MRFFRYIWGKKNLLLQLTTIFGMAALAMISIRDGYNIGYFKMLWSVHAIAAFLAVPMLAFGVWMSESMKKHPRRGLEWSIGGKGMNSALEPMLINARTRIMFLLLALAGVPFAAAFEEFWFRGHAMALGNWFNAPQIVVVLLAVLFSSVFFGFFHMVQGDTVRMCLCLSAFGGLYMVIYAAGGLEAVVVTHITNNLLFFLAIATGERGRRFRPIALLQNNLG
jgi:membrane protease YdiL (CAAX protease family)